MHTRTVAYGPQVGEKSGHPNENVSKYFKLLVYGQG